MKTSSKIILVNLAVLVGLAFVYPEAMVSPGPVKEGHHEVGTDCFACHTPLFGATSSKCTECHEVSDIGRVTTQGEPIADPKTKVAFHQELQQQDCVACHSDHRGVGVLRTARRFSHVLLHEKTRERCASCHAAPEDAIHRKPADDCRQCHTFEQWTPATFDHDPHFRFDRAHETECATCHEGSDYSRYTCYGCHEHSARNIRGEHTEEGIYDFENCVECHRSGDEEEAEWLMRNRQWGGEPGHRRERHWDHDD